MDLGTRGEKMEETRRRALRCSQRALASGMSRAARDLGADRIGELICLAQRRYRKIVAGVRQHFGQRGLAAFRKDNPARAR
jgi:hypothetical protein